MSDRARILVVDDHEMFREAISRFLSEVPGFEVTHAGTPEKMLLALQAASYDMILLDFDLGDEFATRLVPRIRAAGFAGRIVVLTASVSDHAAWQLADAGVDGIILKRHSFADLVAKIRTYLSGVSGSRVSYTSAVDSCSPVLTLWPELTKREQQTLRCIVRGLGNKEIAADFQISEDAVKATVRRLFHKTGARTRSELVRIALQNYSHEL